MTHPFSPAGRQAALRRMTQEVFDLLVIGGGITGCGLARDAAMRGLRVVLVEKEDFGYGTSSRSSKLVHGGLRYLSEGQLGMVWESVRERRVLRAIAPHLVHPLPFIYPLYQGGESPTVVRTAFWLVDHLSGVPADERHRFLRRDEVLERAPGLRPEVTSAIGYLEFLTDDARLTLENGLSAALAGALAVNHARVVRFVTVGGKVAGARIRDALGGGEYEVRAKVTVNATGPWAEETLRLDERPAPGRILLSKGIHLLFRADRVPVNGAVALRAPSGREGFAIPRWDYVYIGTTDAVQDGPADRPTADPAAVRDLLGLANDCFPGLNLTVDDALAAWAGLRPLIYQEGKDPRSTSRHDQIWRSPDGLITIAGGKLTTYRRMAHRILQAVYAALGRAAEPDRRTERTPLPGADLGEAVAGGPDFAGFRRLVQAGLQAAGASPAAAARIAWLYGARARELLRLAEEDPTWMEPLAPGCPALRGEVKLAVSQEMAGTLLDFMDRRSALLVFSDDHGRAAAGEASRIMASLLGWSEARRQAQVAAYEEAARAMDPLRG